MTGALARQWPLQHHLAGALVLAQSEEAGLAEPAVARDLGEADLCDQVRAYPVDAETGELVPLERVRDSNRSRFRRRNARHRSPSSLRSKIQPGSEKRVLLSTASIGAVHSGCSCRRSRCLARGGSRSNALAMPTDQPPSW
jgi:hypothetical protein